MVWCTAYFLSFPLLEREKITREQQHTGSKEEKTKIGLFSSENHL
jgi:hypothetical protein